VQILNNQSKELSLLPTMMIQQAEMPIIEKQQFKEQKI
jgi:hypothetical protein